MSTQITTEQVKELRDATGVSVMQCRNALIEAEGDMEKALLIMKKKQSDIAMKKSDRNANDGIIVVVGDNKKAVLLTLHCETDFVAKNEDFTNLANTLANKALADGIDSMKESSSEMINATVQKVGEKLELGTVNEIIGDNIGSYVHSGKSAVVVSLKGGTPEIARDIAMHIAAMKPAYMTRDEIKTEDQENVKEMFAKDVAESDKPQEIKDKMLEGKINTYFKEQTLVDQSFVKNPDITVGALLAQNNASLVQFIRESIV